MKRVLCFIILTALILSMFGCMQKPLPFDTAPAVDLIEDPTGYKVTNPMAYPDYTFDEEPTIMQLRLTAVRAVNDLLSVNWSISQGISYNKTGPVSNKLFMHQADTTYAGVIYSNASTGLVHFTEYYDHETGRLIFPAAQISSRKPWAHPVQMP